MGIVYVEGQVAGGFNPADTLVTVPRMLVDTGSEFTWIPQELLKEAGVRVAKQDRQFLLADGHTVTRSVGYALLRAAGFETVDEVVFGRPGDLTLLGARTLEGFGAVVNPEQKKITAAGPHVAACGNLHSR